MFCLKNEKQFLGGHLPRFPVCVTWQKEKKKKRLAARPVAMDLHLQVRCVGGTAASSAHAQHRRL